MANQLLMPKLGLTMEEGTLIEWYVKEGDSFEEGDLIFSVETEKLTNDVEVNQSGEILEILVEEGETVAIKTPVANLVGYEGGSASESKEVVSEEEPQKEEKDSAQEEKVKKAKKEVSSDMKVVAAPKARKIASDNNISLEEVAAALGKSKLSVSDVEEYLESEAETESTEDKKVAAKNTEKKQSSSMRKVIAQRLTESWRAPHIYLRKEIDVEALMCFKESLKANDKKVSLNDIILFITAKAIQDYKKVNTVHDQSGEFSISDEINLGLAVAVEDGLLVPVIDNADQLKLEELAEKSKDLIVRTKENKLSLDELQGGTFTITNLGMFGIDEFTAILNPPQSAIMAVGTIKEKLYLDSYNELKEKRVINFTLGVDHRSIDGATAAKFMQKFASYIENPYLCF